jgi:hypothetical protein
MLTLDKARSALVRYLQACAEVSLPVLCQMAAPGALPGAAAVQWAPAPVGSDAGDITALQRFGHSCSVVDASGTWGTELCVVFGGVRVAPPTPGQLQPGQHTATDDVLVLTADGAEAWFKPRVTGRAPSQRAFHAAAACGQHVYVFGGHVLLSEGESLDSVASTHTLAAGSAATSRRKRVFFNDLWRLDTVCLNAQLCLFNKTTSACSLKS